MSRPETTGRKIADDDLDAFSIAEFCPRHSISVPLFYKLREQGLAPDTIGVRRLVTREAAARWRQERTQAAKELA